MNLNKKEKIFKEALALNRERAKIWKQIMAIKPIKLDKPIHHGYLMYLDFRADVKARKDFPRIKEAVELCGGKSVFCIDRSFKKKHGKNIEILRPGIGRIKDPRFQYFPSDERRFERYAQIEAVKKYLRYSNDIFSCNCPHSFRDGIDNKFIPHYEFRHPYFLEPKIVENWLTHYTPKDGALETRLAEIDAQFKNNQYHKILYRRYPDDYYSQWPGLKADTHGYYHGWPKPVWTFN
jgi:hypothetical protein